jgi:UDP-3-O-[3-hydroxymyristoyl] glucosamine N-acyltransferase LpxD
MLHEHEIRRAIGLPEEGDLIVDGVAPLDAGADRCLYFITGTPTSAVCASLAQRSGCLVILPPVDVPEDALGACRMLRVATPRDAIAKVLGFIRAEHRQRPSVAIRRIAATATISPFALIEGDVIVEDDAVVEPFCTVGPDVTIGRCSVIRAGARICPRVSIGEYSVIGANSVIGSEGYGFVRNEAGHKTRIPHLGGVTIGSHVEIGALTIVQYGTMTPTVIEDHAKIDDNVEIGHNVRVGRGASVIGGVVIGGSAVIAANAWIGINSSIREGRRVGEGALIGMDSSVQQDLPERAVTRASRPDIAARAADDDGRGIGFAGRPATGDRR